MFVELSGLLDADTQLTLKISRAGDGKMKVFVIPSQGKAKIECLATPLMLCDTPQVLDAEFANAIVTYSGARTSLASQVAATAAVLGAAEKLESNKAVKAIAGGKPKANGPETDTDDDEGDDAATAPTGDGEPIPKAAQTTGGGGTDLAAALFDQE